MAEWIALIGLPQVSVGIDLHHGHLRISFRMGSNRSQGPSVFARQRDKKPAGAYVRGDKRFNGVDGCTINTPVELQRRSRRDPAPFSKRFTPELLVVEFNLARCFQNGGWAMVRPTNITGGVFVGSR